MSEVVKELWYGDDCYPVTQEQLCEYVADQLMDIIDVKDVMDTLLKYKLVDTRVADNVKRGLRRHARAYAEVMPELVDFFTSDDDKLAEYFENDAEEYFRTPTLEEVENEEYNRTVWEGLR